MRKLLALIVLGLPLATAKPLSPFQVSRWRPLAGHNRSILLESRMLESPFVSMTMTAVRSGNLTDFSTAGPWCTSAPTCITNLTGAGTGGVPGPGDKIRPATFTIHIDANTDIGDSGAPQYSYVAEVHAVGSPGTGGGNGNITFSGGTNVQDVAKGSYTASGGAITSITLLRKGMYTAASSPVSCVFSNAPAGVTCAVTWIQGGGTATIDSAATGVVDVLAGVTLTVRGFATYTSGAGNTTPFFTMQPGAKVISDPSAATAGTFYTLNGTSASTGKRDFQAVCTPLNRCTVSAPTSYTAQFGACSAQFCNTYGGVDLEYVDVTNIGDVSMSWNWPNFLSATNTTIRMKTQHVRFKHSGTYRNDSMTGAAYYEESDNFHENTQSIDGGVLWINDVALTSGTRIVQRTHFDKQVGVGDQGSGCPNFRDFTISDNNFELDTSICGANPIATNYNIYQSMAGSNYGNGVWPSNGIHKGDFHYIDALSSNPHVMQLATGAGGGTHTDPMVEITLNNGGAGVFIIPGSGNPASPVTLAVSGALVLPSSNCKGGYVEIVSPHGANDKLLHQLSFTTMVGSDDPRHLAGPAMNETAANPTGVFTGTVPLNGVNWGCAPTYQYRLVYNNLVNGTTLNDDAISATLADYNFSDPQLDSAAQSGAPNALNQGNGYNGRFLTAPGAHDQRNVTFGFIDIFTSLNTFDATYYKTTKTAFNSGTNYVLDDTVAYTGTIYGAQPVLFHAIASNGPGTSVFTPGVTASWQTVWEWYGKYSLRQDMLTNTNTGKLTVDGAVGICPPTAPCGPVKLRIGWLRHRFQPTNPALRTASSLKTTPGCCQMPPRTSPSAM